MRQVEVANFAHFNFLLYNQAYIFNLKSFYAVFMKWLQGHEAIIIFCSFFLETLYCFSYLQEMEINLIFPCLNDSKCSGFGGLPSWLTINRPIPTFVGLQIVSVVKLFMVLLKIAVARNNSANFFSSNFVVEAFTSVPILIFSTFDNGRYVYIPYFLQCFLIVPSLKILLQMRSKSQFSTLDKILMLIANIFVLLYFGACSFNYFETQFPTNKRAVLGSNSRLSLMDTFYFMVITMTTVGYGDIVPTTFSGQIVIIILIGAGLVIIPKLVTDLQESIKANKDGHGSYNPRSCSFVVVYGNFKNETRTIDFIRTIFKKDNNNGNPGYRSQVVLFSNAQLTNQLHIKLKSRKFKGRVHFCHGNGITAGDFKRIHLHKAKGAIILSDINTACKISEDENNTLRAWAFKSFAPDLPIYCESLLYETAKMQEDFTTDTICIKEMEEIFLAYNCLYRGAATLFVNLMRETKVRHDYNSQWQYQFGDGSASEIFVLNANPVFATKSFKEISAYLFTQFQVILFGLKIKLDDGTFHVVLNPSSFQIRACDMFICIANSFEDIQGIHFLSSAQYRYSDQISQKPKFREKGLTLSAPLLVPIEESTPQLEDLPPPFCHFEYYVEDYPGNHRLVPKCILRPASAKLDEITVQDAKGLQHFIFLITDHYEVLRFLTTLRHSSLNHSEFRQVLIFAPRLPSEVEFSKISRFPEVYIFVGDARNSKDIELAGMYFAERIVIMSLSNLASSDNNDDEDLLDSPTM